jgi:hypothetical protein
MNIYHEFQSKFLLTLFALLLMLMHSCDSSSLDTVKNATRLSLNPINAMNPLVRTEATMMIRNTNELLNIPHDSNSIVLSTTTTDLNSHTDHMRRTYSGTITYNSVGSFSWTVPDGVYAVTVDAWGAQG